MKHHGCGASGDCTGGADIPGLKRTSALLSSAYFLSIAKINAHSWEWFCLSDGWSLSQVSDYPTGLVDIPWRWGFSLNGPLMLLQSSYAKISCLAYQMHANIFFKKCCQTADVSEFSRSSGKCWRPCWVKWGRNFLGWTSVLTSSFLAPPTLTITKVTECCFYSISVTQDPCIN